MYFDRFDICEAYYLYARDYHQGQGSKAYRIFSRLEKLNFHMSGNIPSTENGMAILVHLIATKY